MEIIKSEYGYLSVKEMPTSEELLEFYKNKYFQQNKSVYEHKYSDDELEYINNKSKISEYVLSLLNKQNTKKILDVGAGEGYLSKYFFDKQHDVTCLDFSDYGINNHNPSIKDLLIQGDVLDLIDNLLNEKNKYDFINLSNVLEHVVDPINLLTKLHTLLNEDSLLKISVPNDFSTLQSFLLEKNYTKNTWFCPPEHLHYFTFESLSNLLKVLNYDIFLSMGEFPIELYLINESSNYTNNNIKGKSAHKARVEADNFLFTQGLEKYIDFYKSCANIGLSRQVVIYARKKKNENR